MKRMMILALLCAVLGGCVVVPVGDGYRDDGYYRRHGYDHDDYYHHGYYRDGYGYRDHGG